MTEEYDDQEGRRVWLSRDEVDVLLEVVDGPLRKVAFRLAAECGLRTHGIVEVTPDHVVDGGEAGQMLVVPEGKGEKYREAPIPDSLADLVDAAARFGGVDAGDVLSFRAIEDPRSIRGLVDRAASNSDGLSGDSQRESTIPGDLTQWQQVRDEIRAIRSALEK